MVSELTPTAQAPKPATWSHMSPAIVVLTHFTSPYQVELFDTIANTRRCELQVFYLHATDVMRAWAPRRINHKHLVLDRRIQEEAHECVASADLVVFNYYNDPRVAILMKERSRTGKPWCFWGERPGVRSSGWLGRTYRRWRLAPLQKSHAPVWGIGLFAEEQYRREFGRNRAYHDLPYFSDLTRFASAPRSSRRYPTYTTFLCSGALIRRKGVDLLARAFVRLAAERSDVRLKFVGDGDLRPRIERELAAVADRVEFTGFRDWEHLPQEYQSADILCVPSRHDGWGLVVPEALASGIPVIASDRTGAALELVQPRRNGWLVPANDESALVAAMMDAANLSDSDLHSRSKAALASVAAHTLHDGANRFLDAANQSLMSWAAAAA